MSEMYENARNAFEKNESLHLVVLSVCTTVLGVMFLMLLVFDQVHAAGAL